MSLSRHHKPSTVSKTLTALASDLSIMIIAAVVIIAVYMLDTITPLGQPVWLLYFLPLILSFWSTRYYAIPTVCVVTLLFLVGGFLVSPQGIPVEQAVLNRFIFFLGFVILSIVLWVIRRRQIVLENLA